MRLLFCFLLLNFPVLLNAQCDSASIRQWLQSMNTDTVCRTAYVNCPDNCFPSCIQMWADSSTFRYVYHDSVSGLWSTRMYSNYVLTEFNYKTVNDTVIVMHYDHGKCDPYIVVKSVINDSLSKFEKKKVFYDYYSETVYNDKGGVTASWVETIVVRRGKKFRRTVYIRPTRKFNREKIRMKRV